MSWTRPAALARPLFVLLPLTLLVTAGSLRAQEREIERAGVPRDVADRLIGIANDPTTARFSGGASIPIDSLIRGNVVVVGPLRLDGRIDGEVVVVEGDAQLGPDAEVTGDLTVVGGRITGDELATVGGTLMTFEPFGRIPRFVEADRVSVGERGIPNGVRRDLGSEGSSDFTLDPLGYNRLEGLSVEIGPSFTTGGRDPFRVDAVVIVRTVGGIPFQHDRHGYRVDAEQFLGGRREMRVGGGVFSRVEPIEAWGLTDEENDWSAFLFTSDHRDYFETRGARAFVRVTPRAAPIDLTVEYRDELLGVVATNDPWSLFDRSRAWRDQPLVGEGSFESVVARLEVDTRNDLDAPDRGWLVRAAWREGVGGTLTVPESLLLPGATGGSATSLVAPSIATEVSTAFIDVRRYNPVGSGATLALRAVAGGSVRGEVLPPHLQHTLGGPGSLPGHPALAADCGARSRSVSLARADDQRTMYPFYGCDRVALLQAEYRGGLGRFLGLGSGRGRGGGQWWVVFFDAGRTWAEGDWGALPRTDSETLYDAGVGVLFGGLGVYWAKPLNDGSEGSTLTVRLGRRF